MSTKPTISLARWADLAGSFVTDASSGLRDTGFVDGTPADADILNAELKQLYLWAKWLDDGTVSFAEVDATEAVVATLFATTAQIATLTITTDIFVQVARPIPVGGAAFHPANSGWTTSAAFYDGSVWHFGASPNDTVYANLSLIPGTTIQSIQWFFNKGGNATALTMSLESRNGTTNTPRDTLSDTTSGSSQTSANRTGINYVVASGDCMRLKVVAGNAAHTFSHAIVTMFR